MNILDKLNPMNFSMIGFMVMVLCFMVCIVGIVLVYDLFFKPQISQTCVAWEKSTMLVPSGETVMVLPINKCTQWLNDK